MRDEDDFIAIMDDTDEIAAPAVAPWRILVVDDDPEVHVATDYALQGVEVADKPLALIHASSANEARRILENDRDFAVVLLDVVMETEDAGLQMIRYLRERLGMTQTRIVLRTGQPGYAPELQVFHDYDINDYRTKAELTRTRLITAVTAAVRSYQQIHTIAENKRNLELLMQASARLIDLRASDRFAAQALASLSTLLGAPIDGIFCARQGGSFGRLKGARFSVIGASGEFAPQLFRPLADLAEAEIAEDLQYCLDSGKHSHHPRHSVLCVSNGEHQAALYLRPHDPLDEAQQQLIEIFASNIAANFGNIQLFEQLNFFAYHDELTHLRNRNRFILDLNEVGCRGADIVVALLDLQHFADLNDGLGHETGNALLVAVSRRMQEELGRECLLARIGADVFGIIGPESQVNPPRLFELFATPFKVHEHALPVNAMIGLCRTLEDKPSGITLLKRTNIALNRAKNDASSSHAYFMPEMEDSTRWRLEIIHRLRADFAAERLSVWYQPQLDLATGKLSGIEALLRWPGQKGGEFIQPPDVFVPLAEYSGLIIEIGDWVLDRACAAFAELRSCKGAPERVAVNVSVAQFRQMGLPQRVAETMKRHAIAPGELELEITESIAMDEPKIVTGALLAIKSTGSRIAIDDFGTGYSSLAQLRQLPIDAIKIDKSFIAEIAHGRGGMFAETITALSEKLGVETIAEGVETDEQAGYLRGLGCTIAQGFLYGRPMPLEELKTWLTLHRPWR